MVLTFFNGKTGQSRVVHKLKSATSILFDPVSHKYQWTVNGEDFPKSYSSLWETTVEGFNGIKQARKKVF